MFLKKILFLVLFLSAFTVNADTLPVVVSYNGYSTLQAACSAYGTSLLPQFSYTHFVDPADGTYRCQMLYNTNNSSFGYTVPPGPKTFTCPNGGTVSGSSCINVPACVSPSVRSVSTGACEIPLQPVCSNTQNIYTTDCHYPTIGTAINCTDGNTIYAPSTCAPYVWDFLFSPKTGYTATCSDGSVIGAGANCTDRWFKKNILESSNPAVKAGVIFAGVGSTGIVKPVLTLVGTTMKMVFPIGVKLNNMGSLPMLGFKTELSNGVIGKGISEYIKANPSAPYAVSLRTAVQNSPSKLVLSIDSANGLFTPSGSVVPLSFNQLGEIAIAAHGYTPMPLTEIVPYVPVELMPWVSPFLDALESDFVRFYDLAGSKAPFNFPGATTTPQFGLVPDAVGLPSPFPEITPSSPTTYPKPASFPASTLPSPTANPNPLGIDAPGFFPPEPVAGTPNAPASEIIPVSPSLYPDTYKFFDFLPTQNPFSFDAARYLPQLPSSGCSYEIHQTIHVFGMTQRTFDLAPCAKLAPLRQVLKWAFAVLTAMMCFYIIFRATFTA